MKTYTIQTFGCMMNYSDSERVASVLHSLGLTPAGENEVPDIFIANTCSVRQKSEDKALGMLQNMKKDHPRTIVAVTGCMVRETGDRDVSRDALLRHECIDCVFRIEDCGRLPKLLEKFFPEEDFSSGKIFCDGTSLQDYFKIAPKVEQAFRVSVPIMQGCNKFCAYCIVPYTRGREKSRPFDDIIAESEMLVKNGAKELWFLGQNVNSYMHEGRKAFAELILELDKQHANGLSRFRFMSAHPQDFGDDVIDALAQMKTACPYVHFAAQHGANTVLKRMNRNYKAAEYEEIVHKLRKAIPGITIATDIIVGFPGETEQDFEELCDFARRMEFDFSFTAIYSPRPHTPAAEMTDLFIPRDEQKRRFHIFDDIIKDTSWKRREAAVGTVLEVLVEQVTPLPNGEYRHMGRSREFFEVYFTADQNLLGQEVDVRITERRGYVLSGEL